MKPLLPHEKVRVEGVFRVSFLHALASVRARLLRNVAHGFSETRLASQPGLWQVVSSVELRFCLGIFSNFVTR